MATPAVKLAPSKKPRFAIYLSVVTDGLLPTKSNLLHISAYHSADLQWSRNILPQLPLRPRAEMTGEILEKVTKDAVSVSEAIISFAEWLERFKGKRVAVTSSVAYWHLMHHFYSILGKSPFVPTPVDVASFVAGAHGDPLHRLVPPTKDPTTGIQQRLGLVQSAVATVKSSRW